MDDGDNRIRCFRVQCLHCISLYPSGACKHDNAHVGSERHHVISVDKGMAGAYGGECQRGGFEGNVEGVDL